MADKKLSAEESEKILLVLLNAPENKICADCHAKGPRWASANLGVFVCIKCSGIHRSLGVHISQVRSISLDKWTPEQIDTMKRVGNAKAAELYEATLPENFRRPSESDTYALEQFIREKYDRKLYYRKSTNNSNSHHKSATSAPPSRSTNSTATNHTPNKSTSNTKSAPPKALNKVQEELIQWETTDTNTTTHHNQNNTFEFTSFTGANNIGDDIEFSGFQSASTSVNNSNILQSPRHHPSNNNIDAESAFFSGVTPSTSNTTMNPSNSNAPKPSKDAILQLYNQPISGGITSNPYMGHQPTTTMNTPHQANYNVRMPSLGLGTGGVTMTAPPVGYNMNGPTMYTNNPMMMPQQHQQGMYSTMPPGYVNPMAANMMMNNTNNMPSNYVNPNYLKMMNGGVNTNNNTMNNRPLFN